MNQDLTISDNNGLMQLHSATCFAMTHFMNGHHCPKLAQLIVYQLNALIAHPGLLGNLETRSKYLKLQEHWQTVNQHLLDQQAALNSRPSFH
jgi:hypothetical protein